MKESGKVSNAVIRRLPQYLRGLEELKLEGIERISSGDLSARIGHTASQIRQDLNHFGGFGQQGYGYNVSDLYDEIAKIIGLDRLYKMVFVGCGRLGQAIANFVETYQEHYTIAGMFDINPDLIGKTLVHVEVRPQEELKSFLHKNKIDIGVITVPKNQARPIADILCAGGVSGIWNFAPVDLESQDGIPVNNVHIADTLQALTYYIHHESRLCRKPPKVSIVGRNEEI